MATAKTFRYDGVDEEGQHWLERIEILADGSEIFTESYVPIRLYAREEDAWSKRLWIRLTFIARYLFRPRRSRCGR